MRRHKLRFGGGDTGSLDAEGGKLRVDASAGDTDMALVEGLLDSDSEPSFGPLPSSAEAPPPPVCSSSFSSHSSMLLRPSRPVGCER